jgi:hypothetical protein
MWGNLIAQPISTRHRLNAQAQLILHMDGLESSWEVMNARAHELNKGLSNPSLPLPADDQLSRELRLTLGEIKIDFGPRVKNFLLLFTQQRT